MHFTLSDDLTLSGRPNEALGRDEPVSGLSAPMMSG
jgi:hypothetical protein